MNDHSAADEHFQPLSPLLQPPEIDAPLFYDDNFEFDEDSFCPPIDFDYSKSLIKPDTKISATSGSVNKPLRPHRRTCSVSGCKNGIVQGGLCVSHGAKRRKCRFPGCVKNSKKSGLCSKHGPPRKKCEHPDCTNVAVKRGMCKSHGADSSLPPKEGTRERDQDTTRAVIETPLNNSFSVDPISRLAIDENPEPILLHTPPSSFINMGSFQSAFKPVPQKRLFYYAPMYTPSPSFVPPYPYHHQPKAFWDEGEKNLSEMSNANNTGQYYSQQYGLPVTPYSMSS